MTTKDNIVDTAMDETTPITDIPITRINTPTLTRAGSTVEVDYDDEISAGFHSLGVAVTPLKRTQSFKLDDDEPPQKQKKLEEPTYTAKFNLRSDSMLSDAPPLSYDVFDCRCDFCQVLHTPDAGEGALLEHFHRGLAEVRLDVMEELEKLRDSLEKSGTEKSTIEGLRFEIIHYKAKNRSLKNEITSYEKRMQEIAVELQHSVDAVDEVDKLGAKLAKANQKIVSTVQEMDSLKKMVAVNESQKDKLIEELRNTLKTSRERVDKLTAENTRLKNMSTCSQCVANLKRLRYQSESLKTLRELSDHRKNVIDDIASRIENVAAALGIQRSDGKDKDMMFVTMIEFLKKLQEIIG